MHTELHCTTLPALDPVKAIRAIHEAYLQLTKADSFIEFGDDVPPDNKPVLSSLAACLHDAGHPGFPETPKP